MKLEGSMKSQKNKKKRVIIEFKTVDAFEDVRSYLVKQKHSSQQTHAMECY